MEPERTGQRDCPYCKKKTHHALTTGPTGNEAGRCLECSSNHMTKIQGFNANLM